MVGVFKGLRRTSAARAALAAAAELAADAAAMPPGDDGAAVLRGAIPVPPLALPSSGEAAARSPAARCIGKHAYEYADTNTEKHAYKYAKY